MSPVQAGAATLWRQPDFAPEACSALGLLPILRCTRPDRPSLRSFMRLTISSTAAITLSRLPWRMPAMAARPWLMTYRYHSDSGCPEGGSALANSTILKGSLLQTNLLAGGSALLMGVQHTLIPRPPCANLAGETRHDCRRPRCGARQLLTTSSRT